MAQHAHSTRSNRTPRGISGMLIFGAIAVLAVAGLALMLALVGDKGASGSRGDLFTVRQGDFAITIPTSGELVAQQQVEVRNRLELRAVISEIIPEGTTVQKDDLLMRLNDEEIRTRINDARDDVDTAESSVVAAGATLAIRESAAASEMDRARLNVELAEIALEAWLDGEVVARREQIELNIQTAEINFERLEDRYKKSQELFEQQFISADELKRDEIAMIEARAQLRQAERDRVMYEEHTYRQEEMIKRSDLKQALEELDRVKQRHEAEIETAKAELSSRRHQLQSRRDRLKELEQQLEYCTVYAPSGGLVVYATSLETGGGRRGNNTDPPQVGTELARNELVMILPDTTRMVAAVKVNEALSGLIRPGQPARITSDALPDVVLNGEVLSVGVLAESGGWRDPNRRDYTVRIAIDGDNKVGLRPSMRCRADIFVDHVENAVHVPVQAIFREGRRASVYMPESGSGGRYVPRPVNLGRASELYVEIVGGLQPGERVLLRRPAAGEVVGRRGPDQQVDEQPDDKPRRRRPAPEEVDLSQPIAEGSEANTADVVSAEDASSEPDAHDADGDVATSGSQDDEPAPATH